MLSHDPRAREGSTVAGKYRLVRLIGSGGVGAVYRAENLLVGRTVAIKMLHSEHARDERIMQRFLREARLPNLVAHPNVVGVLDMGTTEDGVPFLVEEYLDGEDLCSFMRRCGGKLPVPVALDQLLPVVEAVAVAHARGVVHRDLKPENIFLARIEGEIIPKLLDFGISHIRESVDSVRVTSTGTTVGTPAYMAPEQLQGSRDVGPGADVWALGVVLFEVLAGQLPFRGDTAPLIFAQILTAKVPDLWTVAPGVPKRLSDVVARCLKRDLTERFPHAGVLVTELKGVHVRSSPTDDDRPTLDVACPAIGPAQNSGRGKSPIIVAPGASTADGAAATIPEGLPLVGVPRILPPPAQPTPRRVSSISDSLEKLDSLPPAPAAEPRLPSFDDPPDEPRPRPMAVFDLPAGPPVPLAEVPQPAPVQALSTPIEERIAPLAAVQPVEPAESSSPTEGVFPGLAVVLAASAAGTLGALLAWHQSDGWTALIALAALLDGHSVATTATVAGGALLTGAILAVLAWKDWRVWRGVLPASFGLFLSSMAAAALHFTSTLHLESGISSALHRIIVLGVGVVAMGAGLQVLVFGWLLWTGNSMPRKVLGAAISAGSGLAFCAMLEAIFTAWGSMAG